MYRRALHIFHRDLRLTDNTALQAARQTARMLIPLFILDDRQIGNSNQYRSLPGIQFMSESLKDLDRELRAQGGKLYLFTGRLHLVVEQLLKNRALSIDVVYHNADYTPFAQKRSEELQKVCNRFSIPLYTLHDALLNPPGTIVTKNGTAYKQFTAFYKAARHIPITQPRMNLPATAHYYTGKITGSHSVAILNRIFPSHTETLIAQGGRHAGAKVFNSLRSCSQYAQERDFPALDQTTHLSPYLKFTIYSPREVFIRLRDQHHAPEALLRQLYWRDFFTTLATAYPYVFKHEFQEKYRNVPWSYNQQAFERWINGTTGFPFIDAGMRQLNEIGWMHNRARLVTASFLVKDMHIDWRLGEAYFARMLIDYDPAVNNGNWQWVAGTGCDAQPYFRILNPWLQQKRFDPECIYIKQWIPELRSVPISTIHQWHDHRTRSLQHAYPAPMLDHATQARITMSMFQQI